MMSRYLSYLDLVAAERAKLARKMEAEALVVEDLNESSTAERNQALHDIHGAPDISPEDDETVAHALSQLQEEIEKIESKSAYELALAQDSDYVTNRKFRIMFLRSDRFDTVACANRMVAFFRIKLGLFGEDKLTKDITLSDLTADEIKLLQSGYIQFLPERDRAGRKVLVCIRSLLPPCKLDSRLRLVWYMIMTAMEEEEDQKRGIVYLYYALGRLNVGMDRQASWRIPTVMQIVPARGVSLHVCYDNILMRPFFDLVMAVTERRNRMRVRGHFGTHFECQYALITFGFPKNGLSVDPQGIVYLEPHKEWLRRRWMYEATKERIMKNIVSQQEQFETGKELPDGKQFAKSQSKEAKDDVDDDDDDDEERKQGGDMSLASSQQDQPEKQQPQQKQDHHHQQKQDHHHHHEQQQRQLSDGTIVINNPDPNDVLFGRGKVVRNHPGTMRYRRLLEAHSETYDSASRTEKTALAEVIIRMVRQSAGRFLKQEDHGWVEIKDSDARYRVSHAFRNRRRLPVQQSTPSSATASRNEMDFRNTGTSGLGGGPLFDSTCFAGVAGICPTPNNPNLANINTISNNHNANLMALSSALNLSNGWNLSSRKHF